MDTLLKTLIIPFVVIVLVLGLVALLPDCQTLPSGFTNSISTIAEAYSDWNSLIALSELWFVLKLIMAIEFALILFNVGNLIYNKIKPN